VTEISLLKPGIGSQEVLAIRCLIHAYLSGGVVHMRQVGSQVATLQWPKGLSHAKCVSIGATEAAVRGLQTSGLGTVALSTCTS